MRPTMDPARVVDAARGFLGTPYRHQGSRAGVGCDCLGLVRGVWRALHGREPERPGAYGVDWAETGGGDPLGEAARRHLVPVPPEREPSPGEVVLLCWRRPGPARHCGILEPGDGSGRPRLIHAFEGSAVVSSALTPGWWSRVGGRFLFPLEA